MLHNRSMGSYLFVPISQIGINSLINLTTNMKYDNDINSNNNDINYIYYFLFCYINEQHYSRYTQ